VSWCLRRGAQRDLIHAAAFSTYIGHSVNVTITVNAGHLQRIGCDGVFGVGHLWDGHRDFRDLIGHWFDARGLPVHGFWTREWGSSNATQPGEHWHLAYWIPARYRRPFAMQLAGWVGEDMSTAEPPKEDIVAASVHDGWIVKQRLRNGGGPTNIAAYFGKAEPSNIRIHGKIKRNPDKVNPRKNGGEGQIEGQRYGITRSLNTAAQQKAGFTGPYARRQPRPDSKASTGPVKHPVSATERRAGVLSTSTAAPVTRLP